MSLRRADPGEPPCPYPQKAGTLRGRPACPAPIPAHPTSGTQPISRRGWGGDSSLGPRPEGGPFSKHAQVHQV